MTKMPLQVWKYSFSYALMLSGNSLYVLTAGIVGSNLSDNKELATLPIACLVLGLASSSIPVTILMRKFGRKQVFLWSAILSIISSVLASLSLSSESFLLFCLSAFLIGCSTAAAQQYRFAAIESVPVDSLIPKATSTVLMGGILAALIGPELSIYGQYLLDKQFSGSFLLLAFVYFSGFLVLKTTQDMNFDFSKTIVSEDPQRSWKELLKEGDLILAIIGAICAYGVMSFIMTATPLSMHHHFNHDLASTKLVIQAHIIAMYLPSLFSGWIVSKLGHIKMMVVGLGSYLLCFVIAYQDQKISNFAISLILLGIGWNFLFVSATSLLAQSYRPIERYKVQGINEFLIYSVQGMASLSSGWLLYRYHWKGLLLLSLAPILFTVIVVGKKFFTGTLLFKVSER